MQCEIQTRGEVKIIAITGKIQLSSNISIVENRVKELLAQGWRNIALTYPTGSFFNSYCIAVLVRSHETIMDFGGTFIIIKPTAEILNFLEMFNINDTIQICDDIEKLSDTKLKKNITTP